MAKYLITGSYTTDGTKGLLVEGGSARKAAVEKALHGLGGKLDAIYYAYGDIDVIVIAEVPDAVSALALSLTVNASGGSLMATSMWMPPRSECRIGGEVGFMKFHSFSVSRSRPRR